MPKKDFPQYEAIKEKLLEQGTPLKEAKTRAAKITNSQHGKVPPSHPKHSRRKP